MHPRKSDKRNGIGVIYECERIVKKGGLIRYDGNTYFDPALINIIGERVTVIFEGNSVWATGPIDIFYPTWRDKIARIEAPINNNA